MSHKIRFSKLGTMGGTNLSPAVKQMLTKLMVLAVGQVSM